MKTKTRILMVALMALPLWLTTAQKTEFKTMWEGKLDNKGSLYANASPSGHLIVGSTPSEFCLMDGNNGKIIYSYKFKDISDGELSNTNYQIVMWDANAMLVFDNKLGKDRMAAINLKDGKMLWVKDRFSFPKPKKNASGNQVQLEDMIIYIEEIQSFAFAQKESLIMIDLMTGKEEWETSRFKGAVGQYLYLPGTNELVMVNFQPKGLMALFTGFKNQLVRINADNGTVVWETTYRGIVDKEILTREPLVTLSIHGDKLFLQLGGLQVFNLESGEELFSSDLKSAKVGPGLFAFDAGDKVAIVGDKGMAAFSKQDGKMMYSTDKFRGVMSFVRKGDNVFLQNKKFDIAGVDLNNGNIKGIVKIKPSKHTQNEKFANDSEFSGGVDMTVDGNYIYAFKKDDVTRLSVN